MTDKRASVWIEQLKNDSFMLHADADRSFETTQLDSEIRIPLVHRPIDIHWKIFLFFFCIYILFRSNAIVYCINDRYDRKLFLLGMLFNLALSTQNSFAVIFIYFTVLSTV